MDWILFRKSLCCIIGIALGAVFQGAAGSDTNSEIEYEYFGSLVLEGRSFAKPGLYPDQKRNAIGFSFEPQVFLENADGGSFSFVPFFRYDGADDERTHFDLREAYYLTYGDIWTGEWELRFGVDRVFWGVAESNHLVDIINQTDLVEHPYDDVKLGQFMAHLTYSADWGVVELFGLPFHRKRTFPGPGGRLRGALVIDKDQATYESDDEESHLDLAIRFSHSVGPLDFGLSYFDGNSRDPTIVPKVEQSGEIVLIPHYELIRQYGLDAQFTFDLLLLKLEAIHRENAKNLLLQEEDYSAFVVGVETTLYSIFESNFDLDILAEWSYDEREERSTDYLNDDYFVGTRLAFNDVQDTEFIIAYATDVNYESESITIEFNRRLSDSWSLELEYIDFLKSDAEDALTYETRDDSYTALNVTYGF